MNNNVSIFVYDLHLRCQMHFCANITVTATFSVRLEAPTMEKGGPGKTKGRNMATFMIMKHYDDTFLSESDAMVE